MIRTLDFLSTHYKTQLVAAIGLGEGASSCSLVLLGWLLGFDHQQADFSHELNFFFFIILWTRLN